jgi:hypothetical protein
MSKPKLKLPGSTFYDPKPIMENRKPLGSYKSQPGQRIIMMVEENGLTQAIEVTDSDQHERCLKVVNTAKANGRTVKVVYYSVRGGVLRRIRRSEMQAVSIPVPVVETEASTPAVPTAAQAEALAIAS